MHANFDIHTSACARFAKAEVEISKCYVHVSVWNPADCESWPFGPFSHYAPYSVGPGVLTPSCLVGSEGMPSASDILLERLFHPFPAVIALYSKPG